MWRMIELNCRDFKCDTNKEGNCLLNKIALSPSGTGIVGHLICNESKEKEPESTTKPEPIPDQQEGGGRS